MTTFTVERTGTPVMLSLTYTSNQSASATVSNSRVLTQTGDVLRSGSGDRFFVGEQDLTGIQCRVPVPHYKISLYRVNGTMNIFRQGELIVAEFPAVIAASSPKVEYLSMMPVTGQRLRILSGPVDVTKGNEVELARTGTRLLVDIVDDITWEGRLLILFGTVWR